MKRANLQDILAVCALLGVVLMYCAIMFGGAGIMLLLTVLAVSSIVAAVIFFGKDKNQTYCISVVIRRAMSLVTCLVLLFEIAYPVFAAALSTDNYSWKNFFSVEYGGLANNSSVSASGDTITVVAADTKDSCGDAVSNTVTITLTVLKEVKITTPAATNGTLTFNYTAGDDGYCTLSAGATFTFAVSSPKTGNGNTKTGTLKISDAYDPSMSAITTYFQQKPGGSFTVDGVAGVTSAEKGPTESYALVAQADSGYEFGCWMSDMRGFLSMEDSYTDYKNPGPDAETVYPLFIETDSAMYYVHNANPTVYYGYLNEAVDAAPDGGIVIVRKTGTVLSSAAVEGQSVEISLDNKKLLVPYSEAHYSNENLVNAAFTKPMTSTSAGKVEPYRTLTVPANTTIICNAGSAITADAWQLSASTQYTGHVAGPYGQIHLEPGSSLVMNSGSSLRAYGYITGSGTVTAESGANVYEFFQIRDWRGGSVTSNKYSGLKGDSFLLSQFYVQNIEASYVVKPGAVSSAYVSVAANKGLFDETKVPYDSEFVMIGQGGLFVVSEGGEVTRSYNASSGRISYELSGNSAMGSISLTVQATIGSITMNSQDYVLNIPSSMSIILKNGANVSVPSSIKLLPDTVIDIEEGATLNMTYGSELILYDYSDWTAGNYTYQGDFYALGYSPNGVKKTGLSGDAQLIVNGTLNIADGAGFYSTNADGTGNKSLSGSGTIVIGTAPASPRTTLEELTNLDTNTNVNVTSIQAPIAGISASATDYTKSMQPNLTYYGTGGDNGFWYNYKVWVSGVPGQKNGVPGLVAADYWASREYDSNNSLIAYASADNPFTFKTDDAGDYKVVINDTVLPEASPYSHVFTEDTEIILHNIIRIIDEKKPTCTEKGYTVYECAYCINETYTEYHSATGHTEVEIPAVLATCSTPGATAGVKCSVCGEILVEPTATPTLDHTDDNGDLWCDVCEEPTEKAIAKDQDGTTLYADLNAVDAGHTVTLLQTVESYTPSKVITIIVPDGLALVNVPADTDKYCLNTGTHVEGQTTYKVISNVKLTEAAMTLEYADIISIVGVFGFTNVNDTTESGMLVWYGDDYSNTSKDYSITGDYTSKIDLIMQTEGEHAGKYIAKVAIANRDLRDNVVVRAYVKREDGSCIYSDVKPYSVSTYANSKLNSESLETSTLAQNLLNLVAATKWYFYNEEPTEEAKNVFADFAMDETGLAPEAPAEDKQVDRDTEVFTYRAKNLLFQENINVASLYRIANFTANTVGGTIFWKEAEFNAMTADQFKDVRETPENAKNYGATIQNFHENKDEPGFVLSAAPAVAAKDLKSSAKFYILAYVIDADGKPRFSGVEAYSVEQYIANILKSGAGDAMKYLAKALYVYERSVGPAVGQGQQ